MTDTFGLDPDIAWTQIVRRPAPDIIIKYISDKWLGFVVQFQSTGAPLHERDEPTLTHGLAAYLTEQCEAGKQPFHGDFFCELDRYDLTSDGTAICIGRTDVEWRLYGCPCFIAEFKILDGTGKRRKSYIAEGLRRFIDGRYAPKAKEGAMYAFLRIGAENDVKKIVTHINKNATSLQCCIDEGSAAVVPSKMAPGVAHFDTSHNRKQPCISPIRLAHVFLQLHSDAQLLLHLA